MKTLNDLANNPSNPRRISESKKKALIKSLETFGDLSGIVFNESTGHIVGGHQRKSVWQNQQNEIKVTETFDPPTKTGTVSLGFITLENNERVSFRAVRWDQDTENLAMIAANKHAGEWDNATLTAIILDLDQKNMDLELSGFDNEELVKLMEPKLPKGKKTKFCPHCLKEI